MKVSFHQLALAASCAAILITVPAESLAQNTGSDVPPVLDVHVHALDDAGPIAVHMCPNTAKFTASDPATKEAPFGWVQEECTPKLYPAAKGEYIKEVVAEMKRLNVTAVVFGDPASVEKFEQADPGRVIRGISFNGPKPGEMLSVEELRKLDPVAYVRFDSVYRDFQDLTQFQAFLEGLKAEGGAKKRTGKKASGRQGKTTE